MKLKPNILLIVVASLAYWAGLSNASAFYDPGAQRWLNRDPIAESGGMNLYQFVANNPIRYFDSHGLHWSFACDQIEKLMQKAFVQAMYDESFGNLQGWADEMAKAARFAKAYQDNGCGDDEPPSPPPCPTTNPVRPRPTGPVGYNPNWRWGNGQHGIFINPGVVAGTGIAIGVGIGIGITGGTVLAF